MAGYRVIVADPPWSYEDKLRMRGTAGVRRSADSHYTTMPLADIRALPVGDLAAENALLFLWCPNTLLHSHGYPTVESWGFQPKGLFHWIKTSKAGGLAFGMGRYFRACAESAIFAAKGRAVPENLSQRNVLLSPALPHSQKPEGAQDSLEIMYPGGPFLELFARRARPGWTCVGNECPETMGVDVRDWMAARAEAARPAALRVREWPE